MTAHNPVLKTVGTVKGMGIDTSHFRNVLPGSNPVSVLNYYFYEFIILFNRKERL